MKNLNLSANPLTNDEKERLLTDVAERGEVTVADEIGIARPTLGRQIAGLRSHRASIICTRVYLSRYERVC